MPRSRELRVERPFRRAPRWERPVLTWKKTLSYERTLAFEVSKAFPLKRKRGSTVWKKQPYPPHAWTSPNLSKGLDRPKAKVGPKGSFECLPCGEGLHCPFAASVQNLVKGESQLGKGYVPEIHPGQASF